MSKVKSFSFPDDWKCLDNLLEKMPRSMDASKTVKVAIEKMLESISKKPFISLDNFADEKVTPELLMDRKTWNNLLKNMDVPEIKELKQLMTKRMSLIDDEIFKRTGA